MTNPFTFDFSNLKGDFLGGLTAGIVALPLALAFGAQTALGAMAGLYGAIAIAIVAAMFGGTATQVSGPTAPMTVVSSGCAFSQVGKSCRSGTSAWQRQSRPCAASLSIFWAICSTKIP